MDRNDVTGLWANPTVRRQHAEHGLCVFWRDHPSGRGRQGFACQLLACTTSDCACSLMFAEGLLLDERIVVIEMHGGTLVVRGHEPPGDDRVRADGLLSLRWDSQTGAIESLEGDPEHLLQVTTWLRGEFDDELRVLMQSLAEQQRARSRPDSTLWRGWLPGDVVGHLQHFPNHGFATLQIGARAWRLEDLHCIDRVCPCQDVVVVVSRVVAPAPDYMGVGRDAPSHRYAGHLTLQLPDPHPKQLVVDGRHLRNRQALLHLWTSFVARHPHLLADLRHRRAQMKRLRPPTTLAPLRPMLHFPKPSLTTCACGSGRTTAECCAHEAW